MTNIYHHFYEMKLRSLYFIFSGLSTFLLTYTYQVEMIYLLGKPFLSFQQTFVFLDLTEAFYTFLKISTLFSFLVSVPFFFYHVWSFFIPSFYTFQRKSFCIFLIGLFFLFLLEIGIIYFFFLPKICHFLMSFEVTSEVTNSEFQVEPLVQVEFTARFQSYIGLLINFLSSSLVLFQIPLSVCFMYFLKVLHVSSFYFNRKFLIFISIIISAFLVPPDFISQLCMTLVFFCVFEVLIFVGLFFE